MPVKAVIFDMDGVIFDTEHLALRLWSMAGQELGILGLESVFPSCIGTTAVRTEEILRAHYGPSFPMEDFNLCVRRHYHEHYDCFGLPVKPGVPELLSALSENRIPLALASSTRTETVRKELLDAGFLSYFDAVIGGDCVIHSKPNPEIFLHAAEALGVPASECYVIEDSFNGIRAAAAAGMHPLMVPDMLQPSAEILLLAERIFPSLYEVRSYLLGAARSFS